MRALVMSDSHGSVDALRWLLEQCWQRVGPVDAYIHCGDGARDFEALQGLMLDRDANAALYSVRGNCDFLGADMPGVLVAPFGGTKLFVTHGHLYRVKSTLYQLDEAAEEHGCAIALYGHTHEPLVETRRTLMINPGSAADGRMALLEVTDGRPRVNLMTF